MLRVPTPWGPWGGVPTLRGVSGDVVIVYAYYDMEGCFLHFVAFAWAGHNPCQRREMTVSTINGVHEKCDTVGRFENPPFFEKWFEAGFYGCLWFMVYGGILLDSTSKVLSLPPIQPLLILSPSLRNS